MAAVLKKSALSSSAFMVLVVFVIVMKSATFSGVDAATESNMCEASSLPLDVIDLIGEVNVTLKTLRKLLLDPLSGEEEGGGNFDTSTSEGSVVKTELLLLLLRKMEVENKQLSSKVSKMEEDHSKIRQEAIQMSLGLREIQAESQKSESPCYTTQWPRDCHDLLQQGKNVSGIYTIYPQKCGFVSEGGVRVWCDLEGEESGWTVVLLRTPLEEQVDFNHGWRDYRLGFGDPQTEYWIGNDVLHILTSGRMQMLRVDMMDWDGNTRYAEYGSFQVESSDFQYRLHVGGFTGNAGDSLIHHNNMLFSTPDRDNDVDSSLNCAHERKSGFWFNACEAATPTNPLLKKQKSVQGMCWYSWRNDWTTLQKLTFKLKSAICLKG